MNQLFRYIVFFIFVTVTFYYAWSEGNRRISDEVYAKSQVSTPPLIVRSIGYDHGAGNTVAIQAFVNVLDYSTENRFYEKIDFYLQESKKKGYLKEDTIVVFPEHIGTPLLFLDEKKEMYAANSFSSAINQIVVGNIWGYIAVNLTGISSNNAEIVFRMKANEMKRVYENTFKKLALEYKVTIIAGSILLPGPAINPQTGSLEISNGKFTNSCFIFTSDGKIHPKFLTKYRLAKTEMQIASEGTAESGFLSYKNIGILLSNDTIYNSTYTEKVKNTEVLISPSVIIDKDEIDWKNSDIYGKDTLDASLTQAELWRKYSIFEKNKISLSNRIIVQVFLLGTIFDLTFEGESAGLIRYVATEGMDNKRPAILNVWF